ncbi:MAG TPA: hypothetical protein VFY81_08935, partial [Gammaproteobacteria bacterium]|nr:hypothetical protein [Gammaproteobacteria bacterium]
MKHTPINLLSADHTRFKKEKPQNDPIIPVLTSRCRAPSMLGFGAAQAPLFTTPGEDPRKGHLHRRAIAPCKNAALLAYSIATCCSVDTAGWLTPVAPAHSAAHELKSAGKNANGGLMRSSKSKVFNSIRHSARNIAVASLMLGLAAYSATKPAIAEPQAGKPAAALEGDRVPTSQGDLVIRPINHATLVMSWQSKTLYVDPVGEAERFKGLP